MGNNVTLINQRQIGVIKTFDITVVIVSASSGPLFEKNSAKTFQ